jgi:hypothetical protein
VADSVFVPHPTPDPTTESNVHVCRLTAGTATVGVADGDSVSAVALAENVAAVALAVALAESVAGVPLADADALGEPELDSDMKVKLADADPEGVLVPVCV